jgi:hypothetical protein
MKMSPGYDRRTDLVSISSRVHLQRYYIYKIFHSGGIEKLKICRRITFGMHWVKILIN